MLRLGGESSSRDLGEGQFDRLKNLMLSGFLCGILWEFWNYWARSKWHYTVPIMEHLKIFEMPVLGYASGFRPSRSECFTMYVFARIAVRNIGLLPRATYRLWAKDRVVISKAGALIDPLWPPSSRERSSCGSRAWKKPVRRFSRPAPRRCAAGAYRMTALPDTADGLLKQRRSVLRVRMESGKSLLTFKGPVSTGTREGA